ncbi:hypothetical protein MBT84_45635 [Streptomyces sp. MBT84]|nr:hypothetical protein [Streptomyces sp. MBT84]
MLVTVFGKHVTIALSATGALIALCWILMQIGNGQVPTAEECRRLAQARGRDTCPLVFVNLGGPPEEAAAPPAALRSSLRTSRTTS